MRTIHKATLSLELAQNIPMPEGSKILTVQMQQDNICIWYECDPTASPVARQFLVMGTGWPLPDTHKLVYLGTVQPQNGPCVWHIYEAI